jgi:uncharacterized protein (UPF0305 family)
VPKRRDGKKESVEKLKHAIAKRVNEIRKKEQTTEKTEGAEEGLAN